MTTAAALVVELRALVAEPTQDKYTDAALADVIAAYPAPDSKGRSTKDPSWEPTYDLHAAAAQIWEAKAAAVSTAVDFDADNGSFSASQLFKQAMEMVRFHEARRRVRSVQVVSDPPRAWEEIPRSRLSRSRRHF